jgi:hypothetical protein
VALVQTGSGYVCLIKPTNIIATSLHRSKQPFIVTTPSSPPISGPRGPLSECPTRRRLRAAGAALAPVLHAYSCPAAVLE